MRQDWVEFKAVSGGEQIIRPEYAYHIWPAHDNPKFNETVIEIDSGRAYKSVKVAEPYEQVKQKIMDAEKVDLSDVVVEHFTREAYKRLLALAKVEQGGCKQDNLQGQVMYMQNIVDKLNEILKEDNE